MSGVQSRRAPSRVLSIPKNEYFLLKALIASDEARAWALPQLSAVMIEGFVSREIFEAIRQAGTPDAPIAFSALEGRLTGPAQALLHEVVAADEMIEDAQYLKQAQACLRVLESEYKKRQT